MTFVQHILQNLDVVSMLQTVARGGGGGSGGGGGGGGGGSGGGGGGIVMVGYIPAHYVSSWLNKHVSFRAGLIGGVLTGIMVAVGMSYLSVGLAIAVGIGAVIGVYSGLQNLLTRLKNRVTLSAKKIRKAALTDPVWKEDALQARIVKVFHDYQEDWSTFNEARMRTYTSPTQYEHSRLLLAAIYQMGRQNIVANPTIDAIEIIEAKDAPINDYDHLTVYIRARAADTLIDTKDNRTIYTDRSKFEEYWEFDRQGDDWVLEGISQATEDPTMMQRSLQSFAAKNKLYFSPDMGWLLLPERGELFGSANFKQSDINNHAVGEWGGLIVQLYTYVPYKARQRADNYLVGQINLPKSYGGIIVKRRAKMDFFSRPPDGYQQVNTEWPDFNARYCVYATDTDKVTSFELLNPAFMADLYDENLPINIEVVDNVVYLYCRAVLAVGSYGRMLEVLRRAYKELKQ